jgi:YbbR domain-containing protein
MRKYLAFLSFLALTIVFWLMSKLAQDYDTVLKMSPNLKSSLSGVYSDMADNTLYIQVRAPGFFILGKKFSENNSITVDIKDFPIRNKTELKIATVNLKDKIRDDFDKSIQILSIEPDTIYFSISKYVTKKVPVRGDFKLSFKNEFRQYAPVQFFPDSVTISGIQEHVVKVKSIALPSKRYNNIDKTMEDISNINTSQDIHVNPSKIRYKIPVERCTEGTVAVPVQTVNLPAGNKLILLPSKVNIKYFVPLKDYNSVSANDFYAEADYNDTKTSLNRLIKVKVLRHPSSVFEVKVEPAFVEFLIQK